VVVALYIELAFMLLRLLIEKPVTWWQISVLVLEELVMIAAFTVLIFCRTDNLTMILISLVIIVLFFVLLWDLAQVYTDNNNEWDYDSDDEEKNSQEYNGTGQLRT